ncbi:MAG: hypothetical protein LW817_02005, partial [Candidatus Caenarcaniphilales bacterium]|nr:hypothetical protein [Candidatus Caenarcaniphilales bacterium]
MLSLLLLVLYLFVAFLFGAWGLKSTGIYQNPKLSGLPSRIVINLCFALSLNLLFAHLLAFPLQNFALAAQITSILITALAIFYLLTSFKEDSANFSFSKTDFVILILAFLIALSAGIRGHLTDSDNTHIPWSHSLVMNHKYPPRLPIDPSVDLGFYHYGTDLYIGSISSITGAMPWDSISMQVAVGCFLAFLSFFVIFNYFFESKLSPLFATLFIFFFTSETSICFFYKYFGQIIQTPFPDLMKVWQDASLVSSVHMPYFAVLVSQNMALAPLLIVFLMAFLLINKSIKPNFFFYLAVAVLSYSAYSCYPAWWYPGLAAFLGFFVIDVFRSKQFKSSLAFLAVFALVKFLSFDGDAAALNGVKAMVFKPSLYWEHYAMNFLGYFDLSKESHLILTLPDYVSGKIVYNVHLFTWLTFINWGLLLIIATILLVCNIKNIFTNKTWIFYLTALPGLAFPF